MNIKKDAAENTKEILIVEDSPTQAEVLKYLLEQHGYAVLAAASGKQALALLEKHNPVLVISDIVMPEMDGYELCRRIKSFKDKQDIPVILLTSLTSAGDVLDGLECGADNFITKPYNEEYLLLHVEQINASRKLFKNERVRVGLEIMFGGRRRFVTADQQQMLTLLISTYEEAVRKNMELVKTQSMLKMLNERLEDRVKERTAALVKEVADHKEAEESLRESEKKFRNYIEMSPDGVFIVDNTGRYLEVNKAACRITGFTEEDIKKISIRELVAEESFEDGSAHFKKLMETGSATSDLWHKHKDGSNRCLTVNAIKLSETRVLGFCKDITVRRKAENALKESEEKFSKAFQTSPYAITITRVEDGKFIDVNDMFASMTGYSREEALANTSVGMKVWVNEEDRLGVISDLHAGKMVNGREYQFRTKSGTIIVGLFSAQIFQLNDGNCILSSINGITERKKAEEDLAFKNIILSTQQDASIDGILVVDGNGRMISFNRRFVDMWGIPQDVLESKSDERALQSVIDKFADPEEFMGKVKYLYEAGKETSRDDITLKDGRTFDRYSAPMIGGGGKYYGRVWYFRDITERKLAEEKQKKLEDQLRQSQKLEAIGQLSSGVAHDFNNLLGGIMGHAELLKMELNPESPLLHHPEVIISSCEKAADLTRQLLTFARKAPVELQKIDLNTFLKQVVGLMDRTIDRRIEIVTDIQEQSAYISGDRNQLENALLNIAINARDAMPEGGHLCISSETVDLHQTALPEEHGEVAEGAYARVSIADTGTGMSKEIKDRIFEPFFTTKEVGKGTGLGLASVYGCVKQHNGYIAVDSQEGKGTQFNLYFPIVVSGGPVASPKSEVLLRGKGTLLLIDDEPVYHEIISKIFSGLGYTVHCFTGGAEGVDFYRGHVPSVQVVILDMNMPKMSGLQCLRHLKEINPGVQVIVSSGYGENRDREAMQKEGVRLFVQKPYKAVELSVKIAELANALPISAGGRVC